MLGESVPRPDAHGKVTGQARYAGDLRAADMLHAHVVFTDRAHARITRLDTDAAEAFEGVLAVITAVDVPVNEYGLSTFDQPVLVGPASEGRSRVATDVSRWEADHLAVIVAESREIAVAAAGLIEADWDELPVLSDLDAALTPGSPLLHEENGSDSNVFARLVIRRGDVEAAFERAGVILEARYDTPHQEHAFLQTEAGVGYIDDDGRVTVETAGQWVHEDQHQIAHALDVPREDVRVIYRAIGGAFGGKEDVSFQIVLALAARVLHEKGIERPVRAEWNREESIVGHHKRHRTRVHTRWAATRDGKILGIEADAYLDAGAYDYTSTQVLGCLHLGLAGPYEIPAARIDSSAVYTNSVPGGAFRGFGAPQGCFVSEMQMNKLADATGIDPVELRRRNGYREGSIGITGTELPGGVHLRDVVDMCADVAAWTAPAAPIAPITVFASLPPASAAIRRGRGFACGYKNVGFGFGWDDSSEARILLHGDDEPATAELFLAGADLGQGAHTAFVQMASEATGLPFDAITPRFSDTATSGDSGSASASRLSLMAGNAILGAAEEAEKAWRDGARPALGEFRYVAPPTEPFDRDGGPSVTNFDYGYVAEAVDLSVDTETGHIVVHDVVCAVDAGRVINQDLVIGQVEGAVVQAHGYVLSEDLEVVDGRILSPRFSSYLIPGIGDVPERVRSVLLEIPDPLGPFGVRGMAEMPCVPYAPAVMAALHDATGVWFDAFPLTPGRVRAGLRDAGVVGATGDG